MKDKQSYLKMGYIQLVGEQEDMDSLYKQFDNGNARIVQFNEDVQKEPIGMVYLSKKQIEQLFK